MKKEKKNMQNKQWQEFEQLAIDCVRDVYCRQEMQLIPTRLVKDNGYDAKILSDAFRDDKILSLIEAKFRNKNVGLRDVAATVIIGYNLGVYRIFFVINSYATPQFVDEIENFIKKTNLKCTIVDNSILKTWLNKLTVAEKRNYSPELLSLLMNIRECNNSSFKCSTSSEDNMNFLKIKAPESNTHIYKNKRIQEIISNLESCISSERNIILCGGEGTGKSTLISKAIADRIDCMHFDMSNCLTTRAFLIKILFALWGIENLEGKLNFSEGEIELITSYVGKECLDSRIRETLKIILDSSVITFNQRADYFNIIILEYLKKLLLLHAKEKNSYFYFYNLEKTSPDVLAFLRSLCIMLSDINYHFILEIRTPITGNEYFTSKRWHTEIELFKSIDNTAYMISIPNFTSDEAVEYLTAVLTGLTKDHALVIVESVGTTPLFLHCAIEWLYNNKIVNKYPNDRVLLEKFKPFFESIRPEQNMVFAVKWIEFFMEKGLEYKNFFAALYILDGNMPLTLFDKLFNEELVYDTVLENLEENGIIFIKNSNIIVAHLVYLTALKDSCSSIRIRRICLLILRELENKKSKSDPDRLKILDILYLCEDWSRLITGYKESILYLKNSYQFKIAYSYMKKIIEAFNNLFSTAMELGFYEDYLDALQIYFQLSASLKYISQPSEKEWINKYLEVLKSYVFLSGQDISRYHLFYNYICSQYYFKNSNYLTAKSFCKIVYDKKMEKILLENIDIAGKLCIGYALAVKEIEGYEAAKDEFEMLLAAYPDSLNLKGEYWVHLSCMELDNNPMNAYKYTSDVVKLYERENMQIEHPLFHKYVDLAMELLFAKDYERGKMSSFRALELAMTNGIIAEEGRAKNILACCEYMLNKDIDYVINLLISSCFLLEKSYYIPYLWRSRINLATFYIKKGNFDDALPYLISTEHYLFENAEEKIRSDMRRKSLHSSREYIALLLIGVYYKKHFDKKYFDEIQKKISSQLYDIHIQEIINGHYPDAIFKNSSYLHDDTVFIVG